MRLLVEYAYVCVLCLSVSTVSTVYTHDLYRIPSCVYWWAYITQSLHVLNQPIVRSHKCRCRLCSLRRVRSLVDYKHVFSRARYTYNIATIQIVCACNSLSLCPAILPEKSPLIHCNTRDERLLPINQCPICFGIFDFQDYIRSFLAEHWLAFVEMVISF